MWLFVFVMVVIALVYGADWWVERQVKRKAARRSKCAGHETT
jgi:hypothetical protein